ncbi:MAG TPA: PPOX class F420-dependent oxidoreductase [Trebonia sp.]|jgi:PPOX class probable F420-dependent enzyme|nr:PPOX class F420-dependent oxidoreductase [Trebonia sp.]
MTTIPDSHRDLLNAQIAVLGTIGASGRPQLSGVWFLTEDDAIKFSLNTTRQKVKNLQADPKASVLIFDEKSPYRYLEIRGDAEVTPDPDYEFADKVGAKYGSDLRTRDKPGDSRVVVTIHPARVVAWG